MSVSPGRRKPVHGLVLAVSLASACGPPAGEPPSSATAPVANGGFEDTHPHSGTYYDAGDHTWHPYSYDEPVSWGTYAYKFSGAGLGIVPPRSVADLNLVSSGDPSTRAVVGAVESQ